MNLGNSMMQELNDEEITALIRVRRDLSQGNFTYFATPQAIDYRSISFPDLNGERLRIFDMHLTLVQYPYGTVACIGGWMMSYMRKGYTDLALFVCHKPRLRELCYPPFMFPRIHPKQAVRAIDNYMFDKPIWDIV